MDSGLETGAGELLPGEFLFDPPVGRVRESRAGRGGSTSSAILRPAVVNGRARLTQRCW